MSAKQPHRKPAGKRKESEASALEGRERKRAAKRKGLKAGSRQQVAAASKNSGPKQAKDPRIGSRKPIVLVVDEQQRPRSVPTARFDKPLSAEQELAAIENDDRLNAMLDRQDAGERLTADEQAWVDERVDRYQQLMDELGIIDQDDEDSDELDLPFDEQEVQSSHEIPASDDELWERFNQADFKPQAKPKADSK